MSVKSVPPRYGIWNYRKKEFQFGVCEPSMHKAMSKLWEKIGKDSYRWQFEVRRMPQSKVTK